MQLPPTILSVDKTKRNKTPEVKASKTKTKKLDKPSIMDQSDTSEHSSSEAEEDSSATPTKDKPLLRPPRTLETTLFDRLERMYGSKIKRMLQVQYRYLSSMFIPLSF